MKFAHENLEVWDKAVDFAVEVINTVENISTDRRHYRLLLRQLNTRILSFPRKRESNKELDAGSSPA
ncbi:MAG: hypothetical protein QME44_09180 [Thermodesulfobacteriota bacterium]|nr:hypothetical protein [Thermodesulfobacteriota bacterium]